MSAGLDLLAAALDASPPAFGLSEPFSPVSRALYGRLRVPAVRAQALAGRRTLLMYYAGQGTAAAVGAFLASARADTRGDAEQLLNASTLQGRESALTYAVQCGHAALARNLVLSGATGQPLDSQPSALMLACSAGDEGTAAALLARGLAGINARLACSGSTPLLLASAKGHTGIVRLLLEDKQCNMEAALPSGLTALALACQGSHTATALLLLERGARHIPEAMLEACRGRHLELVCQLLQHGVSASAGSRLDNLTPLMVACQSRNEALAQLLLKGGASVSACKADTGLTALMLAVIHGATSTAELLLRQGAPVDATTHNRAGRMTALMWAKSAHSKAMCALLLRYRASEEAKDALGRVAQDYYEGKAVPIVKW